MQSLVPSLSLNNIIPFTIFFSFDYLSLDKVVPLQIGKNRTPPDCQNSTPPDWQKQDPYGLEKIGPLRIGKNRNPPDWPHRTPPDWQKQDHSGLANKDPSGIAKLGPFQIGKFGSLPDWQKQDPSGLAKLGHFRIGKIGTLPDWQNKTLPDWDPSGFVKIAFQRLSNFSPDTLPESFSDAIMLLELTRKGVFSFLRPFRIEAKPLI